MMRQHSRPERVARYRRVMDLMEATEEVAGVMESTVDRMLATSQNLDALEDKSQWLLAQSEQFQKTTRELKQTMWWRSCKLNLLLGGGGLVLVLVGVLLVLQFTSVLHLWR